MPITFYLNPASAPCQTVLLVADHLGIELVKKNLDPLSGETRKAEFLAINPQHCIPTIDDDGFYLWESRAIITYFVNKYAPDSPIYPKDPQGRAAVDKMLYYDIGSLCKALGDYVMPMMLEDRSPKPEEVENLKKCLSILESILERTPYAAGNNLTLADFSMFSSLGMIKNAFDYSFADFPKISAWFERLKKDIPQYKEINEAPILELKSKMSELKVAAQKVYGKKK